MTMMSIRTKDRGDLEITNLKQRIRKILGREAEI